MFATENNSDYKMSLFGTGCDALHGYTVKKIKQKYEKFKPKDPVECIYN